VRHGFTNPKAGEYGIEALEYDAQADFESWQGMQAFFSDLFAR
jgi:dienelactone hydrolase